MAIEYQGRSVQQQSDVGLRLEDLVSYDYSAYDSGSGEGAVEIVNRWLIADSLTYSSSLESDPETKELYSASFFQPTVINISGAFYGIFSGSSASVNGPLIVNGTSSFYGPVIVSGNTTHNGYIRLNPVTTNIDNTVSASYIYVSGSTNDLYFTQNGDGYGNTTRLRWLEGNLYTGLLNGGVISITTGSTVFNLSSGSGIIVSLNASLETNPYPTVQYVNWGNFTSQSLTYRTTAIQTFLGIDSNGQIIQQTVPWSGGQYNSSISLGSVLHQNKSTVNASISYPNVAYGWKQRSYDFVKAFGSLKISGYTLSTSGSLGLTVGNGVAFSDGRNYQVDPNNPSYIVDAGTAVSKIFRYYQSGSDFVQDTSGSLGYTTLDSTKYNPNGAGVLTAVSPSKFYVHRIFWYPNSATKGIVDYYGLDEYSTLDDAQSNYINESFVETPNTQQNAIFLGAVIIKGNKDFSSASDYRVLQGGLFRAVGTGGGGGGGAITPGGSTTQIQYNDGGLFAGSANFTFNNTIKEVTITGSLAISGSSIITGSLQVGVPGTNAAAIDTTVGTLSRGTQTKVDWPNASLYNSSNVVTVDWENASLNDNGGNQSVDWTNRALYTPGGLAGIEYSTDYMATSELYPVHTTSNTTSDSLIDAYFNSGHIIRGTVDAAVTDYSLVYLSSTGTWFSLKNISPEATKMVGVCVSQASGTVLIEGDVIVSDDQSRGAYVIGADHGLPIYVGTTNGYMTTTQPTSGVIRVLGHIYHQSTTDANWWLMKFRPSSDWYVL